MTSKAAIKEIKEKDEELSLLRDGWLNADAKNKSKYMRMINKHLDERFVLMKIRDDK
jgi:hypothetical protein